MGEFDDDFDDLPTLVPQSPTSEDVASATVLNVSKNKRKREAEKLRKQKRRKVLGANDDESHLIIDETGNQGVNTAIGKLDPQLIADYVSQRVRRFEKELSSVELEDRSIPASAFVDTSSWQKERNLIQLPDFIETFSKVKGRGANLAKPPKNKGSPHTLVISAAALRAADLTRALRKFQSKEMAVGKLFAKHIKLKESIEYCQNTKIGIGVGTPSRIMDLIKEDALKIDSLRRIIIDASHIDQKKRGIFDIKETQKAMMDLLCYDKLKSRVLDREAVILFY